MRRRLTVAMTLMVAGALLFTGLFTLLLTVRDSRIQTRNELRNQANGLATSVRGDAADVRPGVSPGLRLRQLLTVLRQPLKLDGEAVLVVTAEGEFVDPTHPNATPVLPNGLTASQISPDVLLAGQTITGTQGSVVYAAVPFIAPVAYKRAGHPTFSGPATGVVILTRRPPTGLGAAGPWFLVSSGVIIAIALVVANRLGHRVVRPIEAAEAVTGRIAAGDLAARVPEPPRADPELAALTRAINTMAAGLAQARSAERHFLLSVSHELRTPLTSIRGFAEAIADGAAEDPRNAGEIIALESRRLERLVGDLLDLAKLDARQFSFDMVPVDLAEAVANAADGFAPAAADVGLRLSVSAEVGVGDRTAGSAGPDRGAGPAAAGGATWPAPAGGGARPRRRAGPPGRRRRRPATPWSSPTPTAWPRWWPTCWRTPSASPPTRCGSGCSRRRAHRPSGWPTTAPGSPPASCPGCSNVSTPPAAGPTARSGRAWASPSWPSWWPPWVARCTPSRPWSTGTAPASSSPCGRRPGQSATGARSASGA